MDKTAHVVRELSEAGSSVLTVTRLHPDLVSESMPINVHDSIWLSERPGKRNVPPDQLNRLFQSISAFLSRQGDGTVVLEGVEYILMYNDMKRVLAMIERINDIVMASQAVLVMPVDPMSLDPRTLAYLRRSAEVIG